MYALHLKTVIPEDRRLIVSLPADAPTGAAEIIILAESEQRAGAGAAILQYLTGRSEQAIYHRSAGELDHQIQEERSAWE